MSPSLTEQRRVVTLKLSVEQHKRLRVMAAQQQTTMQAIIMRAVDRELRVSAS